MPDFQDMYEKLFRSMTKAITLLQQAQQITEEQYITAEQPNITVLETSDDSSSDEDNP